jgi:N-acetylglucosaminyl-diphospho-decaprenol L-rhamnosyltransferase
MAEIAVIVVNYGTAELSLEAIASVLERRHGGRSVAVHLVDNASPGGDAERIRTKLAARGWQDKVVFHAETENHGFGRGNNVVLQALARADAPPKYVFLLNPDATLDNETLDILAGFLDAHPQAGAAGAELRQPGNPDPVSGAFRFPSRASVFVEAINFGPVSRRFAHKRVAIPPSAEAARVDWLAGAAVMARFEAWQQAGFFDPAYFLYYEEVDLMLRTHRAGWENWYVPEARAIHLEGEATGFKRGEKIGKRRPAFVYDSWRHYFAKNHVRGYALTAALLWLLGGTMGATLARLRGRRPATPVKFIPDVLGKVIWPLLRGGTPAPQAPAPSQSASRSSAG